MNLNPALTGKLNKMEGWEKHHMPSNSSMNKVGVNKNQGTAINADKTLHRLMTSTGSSNVAKGFRNLELSYLREGKYEAAWDLNAKAFKYVYEKAGYSESTVNTALEKAKSGSPNNKKRLTNDL